MLILEIVLLAYFIYVVGYTVVFAVGGLGYTSTPSVATTSHRRFAVLIPCYKEDAVILDVAEKALLQEYPKEKYTVFIIADSLQKETLGKLRTMPLSVIEVVFENSTKVKALNAALSSIDDNSFDNAVILDADNVMEKDFLSQMNALITERGLRAIQGQRKPKNSNNSLAFLDGVSEAINNHIYRQGHTALGLSSSISGSGVCFEFALLKKKLAHMNSVGGYDRELELRLIEDGIKVFYQRDAVVYDEKTSNVNAFQNQRRRWISSQYVYLARYFGKGMKALAEGNFTFFNSAVLRNIQLPRLLNIGLLTLFTLLAILVSNYLVLGTTVWLVLFGIHTIAIFISIPGEFYSKEMLISLVRLPGIFLNMILILFKLKNANKKFLHTPHGLAAQKSQ